MRKQQESVGLYIRGSWAFQREILVAINLLKVRSPQDYKLVTDNISIIVQSDRQFPPGAYIWLLPAVIAVATETTSNSTWCASTIVHEATHVRCARENMLEHHGSLVYGEVTGVEAERVANAAQVDTLKKLYAPPYAVAFVQDDEGKHWLNSIEQRTGELPPPDLKVVPTPLSAAHPVLWREVRKAIGVRAADRAFERGSFAP